uniref:BHLH domain-containing protein n=1 Tax=Eptatretus burgeri TaxID=7764 RepID=A0A8C4X0H5_EPTBU
MVLELSTRNKKVENGSCILTPPSFTACVKRRHLPYENNICNVRPQRIVRRMFTNRRERWRQQLVATAFAALRRVVPAHPPGRRLSKQRVLRTALQYIAFLSALLQDLGGPEFLNETGAINVMDLTQQVFIPIQDASGEEREDYVADGNRNGEEFVTDGEETVLDETEGEETDAEMMREEIGKNRRRTDKCGKTEKLENKLNVEQGNKIVIHRKETMESGE